MRFEDNHFYFASLCDRYNNLNNVVINRGKLLQTAVHSLQIFDRSMDQVSRVLPLCNN